MSKKLRLEDSGNQEHLGPQPGTEVKIAADLSHSRFDPVVWAEREDELSWLSVHNSGLRRLGGVPAVVRIDNPKTAIIRGAGAWGEINPTYRRYAESVRFHIDACPPRSPEFKGKVERGVRDQRASCDPSGRE
jgi:transposase